MTPLPRPQRGGDRRGGGHPLGAPRLRRPPPSPGTSAV